MHVSFQAAIKYPGLVMQLDFHLTQVPLSVDIQTAACMNKVHPL